MIVTSETQLQGLKRVGGIVARVLHAMQAHARPGMMTAELDEFGARLLADAGADSAPRLCYDFPGTTCISINDEAAHGIPSERVMCAGDLINIDVSAALDGYFADTGGSFVLQPDMARDALKQRLCQTALRARDVGLAAARAGQKLHAIGRSVERTVRASGFRIVRNVCGHGVGAALHEDPVIRSYYDPRDSEVLQEGLVITVEPFLSTNVSRVHELDDGWTLAGRPSSLFAQFEHTIVLTHGAPLIVTALE